MSAPGGLLLTHGAGGGADHRLLVALEDQLDLPVRRMEFPYRAEGRKAPDRAPKLIASVIEEAERYAAEGLPAAAVVLLSYPLHPPGKPERLRIEHFPALAVPSLFVNGDRDPFGTPAELAEHIPAIAGPVEVHWLEGQRHDPKPDVDDEIIEVVGRFLSGL